MRSTRAVLLILAVLVVSQALCWQGTRDHRRIALSIDASVWLLELFQEHSVFEVPDPRHNVPPFSMKLVGSTTTELGPRGIADLQKSLERFHIEVEPSTEESGFVAQVTADNPFFTMVMVGPTGSCSVPERLDYVNILGASFRVPTWVSRHADRAVEHAHGWLELSSVQALRGRKNDNDQR